MSKKEKLIILTGPTAVGKTALSIHLAKKLNGEIISADSMQVYHYMNIGSAKIMPDEMDGVVHHLVDVLDPKESFDVYTFQQLAKKALADIYKKGKIPILVGGTGFYIQALLYDIDFTASHEEEEGQLRNELEELGRTRGAQYLHERLRVLDEESASQIHPNNMKRVIRAIEYCETTGQKFSTHNEEQHQKESPYDFYYFVLNDERSFLYERIEQRVDRMMEQGLVAEVRALKKIGLTRDYVSMQGLGYKEILDYLDDKISLDEAIYLIKRDTRHFAKRQLTWFRREKNVIWIDKNKFQRDDEKILDYMLSLIK